jgi:ATP-dependent DNA helicase MPH1
MDKAKASHKEVQKTIVRGDQLELYGDVERLLPDNIQPQCLEKVMEIQEYIREDGPKKRAAKGDRGSKRAPKRKRDDDVGRNIPTGASTGFVTVSQLLVKGAKKKTKTMTTDEFEAAGEDDEVDAYLEAGFDGPPLKRSKSARVPSSSKAKSSSKGDGLRKSKTLEPKQSKKKQKANLSEFTSSQFAAKGIDDDDDLEIDRGILPSPEKAKRVDSNDDSDLEIDQPSPSRKSSTHQTAVSTPSLSKHSPGSLPRSSGSARAVVGNTIDISDSENEIPPKQGQFLLKRLFEGSADN